MGRNRWPDFIGRNGNRPGFADLADLNIFEKQLDYRSQLDVIDFRNVLVHLADIADTRPLRNYELSEPSAFRRLADERFRWRC